MKFFRGWSVPRRGEIFSACPAGLAFCGRVCYALAVAGRRRTRCPCRVCSVGPCLAGVARRFTCSAARGAFAELLDGLALVSEYQEPEPFGLLRLLYKQFACVRRGHVHLPFWSPWSAVRWAAVAVAVRLPCMIAADFCAVNRAVFVPQSPFRGTWDFFAQNSVAFSVQIAAFGGL